MSLARGAPAVRPETRRGVGVHLGTLFRHSRARPLGRARGRHQPREDYDRLWPPGLSGLSRRSARDRRDADAGTLLSRADRARRGRRGGRRGARRRLGRRAARLRRSARAPRSAVLRPIARRHIRHARRDPNRRGRARRGDGVVVERVDVNGGRVKIGGEVWSARAVRRDQVLEPGTQVQVAEIQGATALVYT